jgi:PAS domain S-box-containing protein
MGINMAGLRKTEQQLLRESEQKYRLLVMNIPCMVFRGYTDWSVQFIDDKIERLTGYPMSRFNSWDMKWCDVILPEDIENAKKTFIRALKTSRSYVREYRITSKNGEILWIQERGQIVCDESGRIKHVDGVFFDITHQKLAEEALWESEARYRAIVEDQTELICRFQSDGTLKFVNEAFSRYYNKKRESLIGRSFWPYISGEDFQQAEKHLLSLDSKSPTGSMTLSVLFPDGELRWQHWTNRAIFDQGGKVIEYQSVGRDVTDLRRAQEALKILNEELEKRVEDRTAELAESNRKLGQEIQERKRVEETLREREQELREKSRHLEEVNTALKILIQQIKEDKKNLEENILANVRTLIQPYIERLKRTQLSGDQQTCAEIIESSLEQIASPFLKNLSSKFSGFTPLEIKIASLIKQGQTSKEIAETLFLSVNTVIAYRHRLRTKLGLRKTKTNLQSYLQSLVI